MLLSTFRVLPAGMTVYLGSTSSKRGTELAVESIIPHPLYKTRTSDHDIGLVKLEREIGFTSNIKPICLPKHAPKTGETCTVTGWGRTEARDFAPGK